MKKLLLFFSVLLAVCTQVHAQSPACLAAKVLSPNYYPGPFVADTIVKVKSTETWFKIPVAGDSMVFHLHSSYSNYRRLASKIELYGGLSCASITLLEKDSLSAVNDSVLIINAGGLTAGDTLLSWNFRDDDQLPGR